MSILVDTLLYRRCNIYVKVSLNSKDFKWQVLENHKNDQANDMRVRGRIEKKRVKRVWLDQSLGDLR